MPVTIPAITALVEATAGIIFLTTPTQAIEHRTIDTCTNRVHVYMYTEVDSVHVMCTLC